jgi:hypothetical protein
MEILQKHEVTNWHQIFSDNKVRLLMAINSKSNHWILEQFTAILDMYGGMGSFTDLFICEQSGYNISPKDVKRVNDKFNKLREKLYVSLLAEISKL